MSLFFPFYILRSSIFTFINNFFNRKILEEVEKKISMKNIFMSFFDKGSLSLFTKEIILKKIFLSNERTYFCDNIQANFKKNFSM